MDMSIIFIGGLSFFISIIFSGFKPVPFAFYFIITTISLLIVYKLIIILKEWYQMKNNEQKKKKTKLKYKYIESGLINCPKQYKNGCLKLKKGEHYTPREIGRFYGYGTLNDERFSDLDKREYFFIVFNKGLSILNILFPEIFEVEYNVLIVKKSLVENYASAGEIIVKAENIGLACDFFWVSRPDITLKDNIEIIESGTYANILMGAFETMSSISEDSKDSNFTLQVVKELKGAFLNSMNLMNPNIDETKK